MENCFMRMKNKLQANDHFFSTTKSFSSHHARQYKSTVASSTGHSKYPIQHILLVFYVVHCDHQTAHAMADQTSGIPRILLHPQSSQKLCAPFVALIARASSKNVSQMKKYEWRFVLCQLEMRLFIAPFFSLPLFLQ